MTSLMGKVALVTGAARGQGRGHALRLASDGADIIAVDSCRNTVSAPYPMATPADLAQVGKDVEALDRRVVTVQADVRDYDALAAAVQTGVDTFGRLDIVCANAGIVSYGRAHELPETTWQEMIDINLTGVWHTAKAAIPHLIAGGRGGSIVITSSVVGLKGYQNLAHYVAAKHGAIGLMKSLARELAPESIRVNAICPSSVDTAMHNNEATTRLFAPDLVNPTHEELAERSKAIHELPIPYVDVEDVSNALAFLVSDAARYITGMAMPVDGGALLK